MTEGQKRPKGQKRGCGKSYKEKLGTMPSFFCTYLSFVAHVSFVSLVFHESHDRDQPKKFGASREGSSEELLVKTRRPYDLSNSRLES